MADQHQHPRMGKEAVLFFDSDEAPLALLASAAVAFGPHGGLFSIAPRRGQPSALQFIGAAEQLTGDASLLARAVSARSDALTGTTLLGHGQRAALVSRFSVFAQGLARSPLPAALLKQLDDHLVGRVVLVEEGSAAGEAAQFQPSLADFEVWGVLKRHPDWFPERRRALSSQYPNLVRWFDYVDSDPRLGRALDAFGRTEAGKALADAEAALRASDEAALSAAASASAVRSAPGASSAVAPPQQQQQQQPQQQPSGTGGGFEIELPGAEEGKVVTRFPPEPSGYLHVGHAKAAMLNDYFAKLWKGKMLLRFDDTNPSKEKDEYVQNIIRDLRTLGVVWTALTHTSDYFDHIMGEAERMIREGKAYVDDTPVDEMRTKRQEKADSPNRSFTVEQNLALWDEMKRGTPKGFECCLRAKIDMQSDNGTMRDPVMYRCNDTPHHRTGSRYKLYPTYDFACPIVDSIEGVTHTLRTSEYHDRNEQYSWFCRALNIREPAIWDYGRLSFKYTLMSKRKLQWFVDSGRVEGWFDPRFPTVQGMVRRGMNIDALREFVLMQGPSKYNVAMEWDKIWTMNKRAIDPLADRFMAVSAAVPAPLRLADVADPEPMEIQCHPKEPARGTRTLICTPTIYLEQEDASQVADGEEVTLRHLGNAVVDTVSRGGGGDGEGVVVGMTGRRNPGGDPKKTKKKLTWVPAPLESLVPITLVEFGHLITKAKLEEEDKLEDFANEHSRAETQMLGEPAMANIKENQIVQIERRGFCRCDRAYGGHPGAPLILFMIPDGKEKSMSTLSSKVERIVR